MNFDQQFSDELEDCAADSALYVLGALPFEMASAFEQRVRSGCRFCSAQAQLYASVAEQLSFAAPAIEPRPELREKLLSRIKSKERPPQASEHTTIVRGNEAPWSKMRMPGVEIRQLVGNKTFMLRLQPGAVFPQHEHRLVEQCYVLDGSITDSDGVTLYGGDFVVMSAGITHDALRSDTGCTLLIAYTG
jgi:quercetin dioxygenase-like cupin family protein